LKRPVPPRLALIWLFAKHKNVVITLVEKVERIVPLAQFYRAFTFDPAKGVSYQPRNFLLVLCSAVLGREQFIQSSWILNGIATFREVEHPAFEGGQRSALRLRFGGDFLH